MKKLAITQLVVPEGFRSIVPTDATLLEKTGLVVINGQSGAGKSSLIEIMRLATQGKSGLRDNAFIREGENECEIIIKIADVEDPKGLSFYLCANAKATGEVDYKFKIDVDGKLKTIKEPIQGLGAITPTKMMSMMSTTLTHGASEFMSESEKVVTEFIFKTFPEVSEIAKPIQAEIDQAVLDRDRITERQTAIGAFNNKLEGLVKPIRVDENEILTRRGLLIQELADAKAEDKSAESNKEQRLETRKSELENIKLRAENATTAINKWNEVTYGAHEEYLSLSNHTIAELESNEEKFYTAAIALNITSDENFIKCHLKVKENIGAYTRSIALIPEPILIDVKENTAPNNTAAQSLLSELIALRAEYSAKAKEINAIIAETPETLESKAPAVQLKLDAIDAEMERAKETNALWEKFDVFQQHTEAHQRVLDLRAKRNKLYESIDTGVKGLTIQLTDEDGKKLGFFYNGVKDPEYFGNPEKHSRALTSYSQTQKTFVAMMLALSLMNKKAYPLNAIFIDNTGMDKRIYKMFDDFAKAKGLLIFMTQTNDKAIGELNAGEILISDGEVIVKQFSE